MSEEKIKNKQNKEQCNLYHLHNNNNNNSIQFFIIFAPSQQVQGQLKTQHSIDTSNYTMDKHSIKSKTYYRQVLEGKKH
jgi:hypothetical protein